MVKQIIFWKKGPGLTFSSILIVCILFLSACSSGPSSSSNNITITLAAPNQFTTSSADFGPAWSTAVSQYEKLHPNVTVKIDVLPLVSFNQTISTQLAAGTAPDIVFNQATYKSFMVTKLDSYFNQPNPYAPGKAKWIDWFNTSAFSFSNPQALTPINDGHLYWVPLNLVGVGLFVNMDAFQKAGVAFPIKTFVDWESAATKLKAAGYTPMAMDNSTIGMDFPTGSIFNQLMASDYNKFNWFDGQGKPGTNPSLTVKDLTRAIKTGALTASAPEVAEALTLGKELFSQHATPNWSGITNNTGAGVGLQDFLAGKAAMAWAVNFGVSAVAGASFKIGSMGFPTITTATTPLSTNEPASFGVQDGGTSYMIPSTIKGDQLKWAVDFLQYMTAPKYNQPWVTGTSSLPSVQTVTAPSTVSGFSGGDWGKTPKSTGYSLTGLNNQQVQEFPQIMDGFYLGKNSLSQTEQALEASWQRAATANIQSNNWGNESWAK